MKEVRLKETRRLKDITGTYDVELEEVSRKQVFPDDEVREIIAEAIKKVNRDIHTSPGFYSLRVSLDPYDQIARLALEDIKNRFDLTIRPKESNPT